VDGGETAEPQIDNERNIRQLVSVFSTSTRRRIIRLLASEGSYTFTEILNHLRMYDEGVRSNNLSYHLKELGDLIEQDENAEYRITPKGMYVKEILDDLEETMEIPSHGDFSQDGGPLEGGIEKVVVGGLLVKVPPTNFLNLARQKGSLVVHSRIGTFRQKEIYFACIDGMNLYCKSKLPLEGIENLAEAMSIEIPRNMIVDI
jgi:DNA-binding transcriptional ArsR family regulator